MDVSTGNSRINKSSSSAYEMSLLTATKCSISPSAGVSSSKTGGSKQFFLLHSPTFIFTKEGLRKCQLVTWAVFGLFIVSSFVTTVVLFALHAKLANDFLELSRQFEATSAKHAEILAALKSELGQVASSTAFITRKMEADFENSTASLQRVRNKSEMQLRQLDIQFTDLNSTLVPVGTIWPFAGEQSPSASSWMVCDGRSLNKAEYKELYAAIGDKFNTAASFQDSTSQFQLPDLRGRTVIGAGKGSNGGALSQRNFGTYLGEEAHTLSIGEMPTHSHGVNDPGHTHPSDLADAAGAGYEVYRGQYYGFSHPASATTGITLQDAGASQAHENMQPSAVVNFIIKLGRHTPLPHHQATPIPRPQVTALLPKPERLLGFWPLSSKYTTHDVSPHRFDSVPIAPSPQVASSGPYGGNGTALVPGAPNAKVGEVANEKLSVEDSFTVVLFFKRGGADDGNALQQGGIFEFLDKYNTTKAFQFRYMNRTTIEVSANDQIVGEYKMIQQKGAWTFMAFVFKSETATLTVYGRHGVVGPPVLKYAVYASNTFNNAGVRLGYASRWQQGLQRTDAVSCLMVYSTALNAVEIRQAYDACRIVHESPPCGSPKLPLAQAALTTIAKPGQFPFIAVVRMEPERGRICSASIIDDYWLLTSASCFQLSKEPSLYSVFVGEHDLNVTESHTRKHGVSKIILSDNSESASVRDVALIELASPIDFTSDYANDACLLLNDGDIDDHSIHVTQFIFGWGRNGRRPTVSTTLPRYVPGLVITSSQCAHYWRAAEYYYDAEKDFCFMSASNESNVPCTGDEGGALLLPSAHSQAPTNGLEDRLIQVGVYYGRADNCTFLKPALFSKVSQYSRWIRETIACAIPGVVYPQKCLQ